MSDLCPLPVGKLISSRAHPIFKQIKTLIHGATTRQRQGQAVLEGIHLAQAWLSTQGLPDYCLTTEDALGQPEIANLVASLPRQRCLILSEALFRELSSMVQGSSILFLVTPPQSLLSTRIDQDCVILDRIQDPGNVGSILRSSAAAGIKLIVCTNGTAAVWSPKVLRAAMGAHCQLEIIEKVEPATLLAHLDVPILATCAPAAILSDGRRPISLYQADLRSPLAWALGNEGSGLSSIWLERAQGISIPQPGGSAAVESLNVAAAAAVCLFETLRQRL